MSEAEGRIDLARKISGICLDYSLGVPHSPWGEVLMTQDCNNSMLRRASRMLGQLYDDELAPSGLRATQHGLLAQIHRMGRTHAA